MSTNLPLTDAAVEAALTRAVARVSDARLLEDIMDAVGRTPQVRRLSLGMPEWLTRPSRDASLRAAILVVLVLIALLAAAMFAGAGHRDRLAVLEPTPSPTGTAVPSAPDTPPQPASPAVAISSLLAAWHSGDVAGAAALYATDHALRFVGDPTDLELGARHFEVRPEGRGYVYWEAAGAPVTHGRFWVLPSVAGVWDPGRDVMAVFRFDDQGRIAAEWIIAADGAPSVPHEARKRTEPASAELKAMLDRCADRSATVEVLSACYAPDGGFWVSTGEGTAWTEAYTGQDGIQPWIDGPSAYDGIVHTGDPISLGSLVAYPFKGADAACAVGVDVFELAADQSRIAGHWAFCGPDTPSDGVRRDRVEAGPELPSSLIGSWSTPGIHPATLTLHACAIGELCGTFERFDGSESCVYPLEYRGAAGDTFQFFTTDASSFGCGWSAWWQAVLDVRPTADGAVDVLVADHPATAAQTGLRRVEDPPDVSASPSGSR